MPTLTHPTATGRGAAHRPGRGAFLAAAALLAALVLTAPAVAQPPGFGLEEGRHGNFVSPAPADETRGVTAAQRGEPRPRPDAVRRADLPRTIHLRGNSAVGHAADHILVSFAGPLAPGVEEQIAAGLGAPVLQRARHAAFHRVQVPAGQTAEQVIQRFRAHPAVAVAETDPLVRAAAETVTAAAAITNDPFFSRQWHLQRIGLDEALDRNPADGNGVIVAVLDSGVAFGTGSSYPSRPVPDLTATAFVPGFDFVDDDPVALDLGIAGGPGGSGPRFSHGTFAASIIAATVNNGVAGAGIAPRAAIMPIRVLGIEGFGFSSDIAEGIRFAVDNGARVINLSLGGTGIASVTRQALAYAEERGVVVVAAAGNEADDSEVFEGELDGDVAYPARVASVIAVGATGFDDQRTTYSNFGPNLDITAPAGQTTANEPQPGVLDAVLATGFLVVPQSGQEFYGGFWATGTSFACPQVAGVAALLISLGVDGTEATRAMMELTARDLGPEGFDNQTGHGGLDAAAAHRGLGFAK